MSLTLRLNRIAQFFDIYFIHFFSAYIFYGSRHLIIDVVSSIKSSYTEVECGKQEAHYNTCVPSAVPVTVSRFLATFDGLRRTRSYLSRTLTAGKMVAINFMPTFRRPR